MQGSQVTYNIQKKKKKRVVGWFCYKLQNLLAIHQSLILNASALSKHLFFSFSLISEVTVTQLSLTLCSPIDLQSMEFSRSKYESGQPSPSPGDFPSPGMKPRSPILQADFYQQKLDMTERLS